MDNNELLQALRQIVKEEVSDIVDQKLQDNNVMVKEMIQESQKDTIRQVNVLIESGVEKQIKAIAEGHMNLLEKIESIDRIDSIEWRMSNVETAVKRHTEKIGKLEKAN